MEYFISFFFMEVASKTHKSHANDRGTLRYKSGITFWNLENCDIRQVLGPRRAGYHRFYCTLWQIPGVNIFFLGNMFICVFLSWVFLTIPSLHWGRGHDKTCKPVEGVTVLHVNIRKHIFVLWVGFRSVNPDHACLILSDQHLVWHL